MKVSSPIFRPLLLTVVLLLTGWVSNDLSAQISITIRPVLFSAETPPVSGLVSVAPNPGSDSFEVYAAEGVEFNGIKVYNSSGSLLYQADYEEGEVWSTNLATGLYYFHVDTNDGVEIETVQVQE